MMKTKVHLPWQGAVTNFDEKDDRNDNELEGLLKSVHRAFPAA